MHPVFLWIKDIKPLQQVCGRIRNFTFNDAPPNSLIDSNVNPKMKTMKKEIIGVSTFN